MGPSVSSCARGMLSAHSTRGGGTYCVFKYSRSPRSTHQLQRRAEKPQPFPADGSGVRKQQDQQSRGRWVSQDDFDQSRTNLFPLFEFSPGNASYGHTATRSPRSERRDSVKTASCQDPIGRANVREGSILIDGENADRTDSRIQAV